MRYSLITIIVLLLFSCNGIDRSPVPDPFFEKEKMAAIMTDVYLVEGAITANRKSFLDLGVVPDEYIYSKHGIDSISFKKNFNYYADRVEEFHEVIEIVEENLKVVKDSVNARQLNSKQPVQEIDPEKVKKIRAADSVERAILSYPKDRK